MTQGKVTSLEMIEIKWVTADLNQTVCKRATSRRFFSIPCRDAVRCTLVAGKPVLERKVYFLTYNRQHTRTFHHSTPITYSLHKHEKNLSTPVKNTCQLGPGFITFG